MKKKEAIYVALSFFTAIGQLTWVQTIYNDPAFAEAWTLQQWRIILSISSVFVITQTLITWKAFLSDPNPRLTNEAQNTPPVPGATDGTANPPGS